MFVVHGSLAFALILYLAIAIVALPFALFCPAPEIDRETLLVGLGVVVAGIGFGIALWSILGALEGDGLFHLARVRKLEAFGSLSLACGRRVHRRRPPPGLRVPALARLPRAGRRLAGVDPALVFATSRASSRPAVLVAYEAGHALFRRRPRSRSAVAQVGLISLAPGRAAPTALALPPTAARQLLVPAAIALFFAYARAPVDRAAPSRAAALALALVHPTYAVFLAVPLAGYLLGARSRPAASSCRGCAIGFARACPRSASSLWRAPIVRGDRLARSRPRRSAPGSAHYVGQIDVFSDAVPARAPRCSAARGAVAIAALLVLSRSLRLRRCAAGRRSCSAVRSPCSRCPDRRAVPAVRRPVSLSQARRAAGFLPLPFAFAGGAAVLARTLSWVALPVALGAGIALELLYPGEFTYRFHEGGPAIVDLDRAARRSCGAPPRCRARRPRYARRPGAVVRRRRRGVRDPRRRVRVRALEHGPP